MSDPILKPCSCGSRVFKKTTEMRGYIIDTVTILKDDTLALTRANDRIRVEREPKAVTCAHCGKRNRFS